MKKAFLFIVFLFAAANSFAQSTVYVKGYTKSNGTYVEDYYRTAPNNTTLDNYSTKGNYNPYTGNYGTKPVHEYQSSTTYTTSNYNTPSYTPVYTGPRGGTYYINSNGNKTYIK